jgi:hypothetical protein
MPSSDIQEQGIRGQPTKLVGQAGQQDDNNKIVWQLD